ncbi:PREDICTED: U3 small nucleolar RNA-associated protein 6 homolog [Priapulus caudatus]|uniref:U3 small nucleolar RNA-associated protein 6 homolog n=1 Tax=Priapulus caudatus TaxID=37621 RepID=A0ABM1F9X4_PRICU|nr:PREDICTED: U3 small nucleolar RNA-associated protein 6 homolog [Priapulus caudatus]
MAEFVQKSLEEILPELEQMKRVKLFSQKEIKKIIKKTSDYEYKLRRKTKCKEDFLNYAQYEITLLSLIKKRRARLGYHFKKEEIDYPLIHRIHRLFRYCEQRFSEDVKVWLSHIEFCKKVNQRTSVGNMFTHMLQRHSGNPQLWILAAKWEFEEENSTEKARELLQRGLRFHPTTRKLWLEYYRMELLAAEQVRKRREVLGIEELKDANSSDAVDDVIMRGHVALVVYRQAIEAIPDVNFCVSFLPICKLFNYIHGHEEAIVKDLQEKFTDREESWDTLAQRHMPNPDQSQNDGAVPETIEVECWQTFEEAIEHLPTQKMWTLYANTLYKWLRIEGSTSYQIEQRMQRLLEVLQRAADSNLLSDTLYAQWLNLLEQTGQIGVARKVARHAVKMYPLSIALWKHRLALHIHCLDDPTDVRTLLDSALSAVAERESFPLWMLGVEWCLAVQPNETEDLLKAGVGKCREVCVPLKEYYLEWAAMTGGVSKAREVYSTQSKLRPLSVGFFTKYAAIENAVPHSSIKRLRKVHEDAVREFGDRDIDVWLEYVKLEGTHAHGNPSNSSKMYWRAKKALDGKQLDDFITAYSLLNMGHDVQSS